ncbi:hypothetical protein KY319_04030, partial [Candidatus Woesearchaeota archaeon]|nr:hypothetical protein [Candidatus Woesearchaeota archaeon]
MRTPVLIFIILLSVACVSAVNVTLIPQAIYETTSSWEALDVNNYRGSSVVSRVAVGSPLRIS